jgi:hypothetical protein
MSSANISFRSPNGYSTTATITKVTGSPKSRTYTGYVTVPQCGDPGTWKANVYLYDVWGFNNFYSPAALAAKRLPVNLSVVDLDAVAPTVSGPSSLHAGQSVTVKFSEPVLFKNSIASTIRTRVNFSDAPGTWVCKNGSAAVVTCDANGANVVTATWTPTTPLTVGQSVSMQAQAVYPAPTGIYDRTGNALSYLYVGLTVT